MVAQPPESGPVPPRRWRWLSLPRLFAVSYAPMAVYTLAVTAASLVVLPLITQRMGDLLAIVGHSAVEEEAVQAFGATFRTAWAVCLGGLYVASVVGAAILAWTQYALSERMGRIIAHAERLGAGDHGGEIVVEAPDALGKLEQALAGVARQLAERDVTRATEAREREQLAMIQRAMALVDSEPDAIRVVGRALHTVARGTSAELLMADSSHAHLRRVVESTTAPPPGCAVEEPQRCPAVQRATAQMFLDSGALDACPRLQEREKPCSAFCIPVMVMGRSVGVLHATQEVGRPFARGTAQSLETLAVAFGTRSGALRSLGTAQLQAETDPLTGLINRRSLENKAAQLLHGERTVVAAMADLDHFKRLNDTHGHGGGDRALRSFAQLLKATLRPTDVIARYGGEEFALLLPDCSTEDAVRTLDRVRGALAAHCARGGGPTFTVSFGVSEFPRHGADLEALLKAADSALYRAKQEGRDRVCVAV